MKAHCWRQKKSKGARWFAEFTCLLSVPLLRARAQSIAKAYLKRGQDHLICISLFSFHEAERWPQNDQEE